MEHFLLSTKHDKPTNCLRVFFKNSILQMSFFLLHLKPFFKKNARFRYYKHTRYKYPYITQNKKKQRLQLGMFVLVFWLYSKISISRFPIIPYLFSFIWNYFVLFDQSEWFSNNCDRNFLINSTILFSIVINEILKLLELMFIPMKYYIN